MSVLFDPSQARSLVIGTTNDCAETSRKGKRIAATTKHFLRRPNRRVVGVPSVAIPVAVKYHRG